MSRITVIQPNGNYAVWSTNTETFLLFNTTKEAAEEFLLDEWLEEARRHVAYSMQLAKEYQYRRWHEAIAEAGFSPNISAEELEFYIKEGNKKENE